MAAPHSRQMVPATLTRGVLNTQGWANVYGKYGRLTTMQMRRLANWGIPGAAKNSLLHMAIGHPWAILNDRGKIDDNTKYYTDLVRGANGGMGGAEVFLAAWGDDLLCSREGGLFEVHREDDGVPNGVWNIDASTVLYNGSPDGFPYLQRVVGETGEVHFRADEIAHALWHPFTEIYLPMHNRTPIQLAYLAITVLANADDWNLRSLTEAIPQGILNLGIGFDQEKAEAWKASWDAAMLGGKLQDIGLLWGTEKIDFHAFSVPPKEMGFQDSNLWYSSVVAACFEMSILDLSILTKGSSRGNSAEQTMLTRRQGLRHILKVLARCMEYYILPDGYRWQWEGLDPRDDKADAEVKRTNAQTLMALIQSLGITAGIKEARRWNIVSEELAITDIAEVSPILPAYAQLLTGAAGNAASTGKPFQGGAKRDETTAKPGNAPGSEGDQRGGSSDSAANTISYSNLPPPAQMALQVEAEVLEDAVVDALHRNGN